MKNYSLISRLLVLLSSVVPLSLPAAVLVDVDFENNTVGALAGQSAADSGTGLTGSWAALSAAYTVNVVSGGLSYSVAGGGTIDGGNNATKVSYGSTSGAAYSLTSASLASSVSGANVFISTLIQRTGNNTGFASSSSFNVKFFAAPSTTANAYAPGLGLTSTNPASGVHVQAGDNASNSTTAQGEGPTWSSLTSTGVYFLVAEYVWDADANAYTSVNFWLNPSADGTTSLAHVSYNLTNSFSEISYVGISVSNWQSGNAFTYDDFTLGQTWNDVVPQAASIPEPGMTVLLAGGTALLASLFMYGRGRRLRSRMFN